MINQPIRARENKHTFAGRTYKICKTFQIGKHWKEMKIEIKRTYKGEEYTIGKIYVNGEYFCDTLEDKVRDFEKEGKVYSKTAIPSGEYKVIVNQSPKFGRMLPRLLDVPHFEGILIHRGNTHQDTAGCILIGENRIKGKVVNSTKYEEKLTSLCHTAQLKGEEIIIAVE